MKGGVVHIIENVASEKGHVIFFLIPLILRMTYSEASDFA